MESYIYIQNILLFVSDAEIRSNLPLTKKYAVLFTAYISMEISHCFFLILGNGPITVSSHALVVHVFISCGTILAVNPCFVDFCCHTTLAAKNLALPFTI